MSDDVQRLVAQVSAEFKSFKNDMRKVVKIAEAEMKATEKAAAKAAKASADAWRNSLNQIKGFIGAYLGVQAVRGLADFTMKALSTAAAIKDVAMAADVSTKYLQEMRFAAAQNGASAEVMDDALEKLNVRLGDFRTSGAGSAKATLEQLGLATRFMSGEFYNTEDAADAVFRALAGVKSNADRAAMASDLFGKSAGPKLAEFLTIGEAGMAAARAEAQRLGLVIGDDMIESAGAAEDKLNALWETLQIAGTKAIADNASAIEELAATVLRELPDAIKWVERYIRSWTGGGTDLQKAEDRLAKLKGLHETATSWGFLSYSGDQDLTAGIWSPESLAFAVKQAEAVVALKRQIQESISDPWDGTITVTGRRRGGQGVGTGKLEDDAKNAADLAKRLDDAAKAMAKLNEEIRYKARDLNADTFEAYLQAGRADLKANLETNDDELSAWDRQFDRYAEGLEGAISDVLMGGDLDDAAKYFAMQLARTVADDMAKELYDVLKGVARGSGDGGGLFEGLVNFVGGLFGGGKSNVWTSMGKSGGWGGPRATGGRAMAGVPYLVGEKRPELFVPDSSGYIMPQVPNLAGLSGRQHAGPSINATFYGASRDDIPAMKEMLQQLSAQQAAQNAALPGQVRVIVRDAIGRGTV